MSNYSVRDKLKIIKDNGNVPLWGIPWAKNGLIVELTASVEQVIPIPNEYNLVLFSYSVGTNVIIKPDDGTPVTLPPGAPTATIADINPILRTIEKDTALRLICNTTAYVKMSFYNE